MFIHLVDELKTKNHCDTSSLVEYGRRDLSFSQNWIKLSAEWLICVIWTKSIEFETRNVNWQSNKKCQKKLSGEIYFEFNVQCPYKAKAFNKYYRSDKTKN